MTFETLNLSASLNQRLKQLNFIKPTEIQEKAIPVILSGQNILASAQTGTGKTAAFGLPILEKLLQDNTSSNHYLRALILAPTRELAAQIAQAFEEYGKHTSLKMAVVYGGVKLNPQIAKLRRGVDILVATPGRLIDLYNQRAVDFSRCQHVVLDEADRMLDMGFVTDIRRILTALPKNRQTMLFSATFSKEIRALAKEFATNAVEISASPENSTAESVMQAVYPVDQKQKTALLAHLVHHKKWEQALVFVRTKHGADRVAMQLESQGIVSDSIHGNKSQSARQKVLKAFKSGAVRVLVATDVAARGLDINQLPIVVNFELPQVAEDYVHRIGRTGRAGSAGTAYSLVCYEEYSKLVAVERLIKQMLPRESIDEFAISKDLPTSHDAARDGQRQRRRRPGNNSSFKRKPSRKPARNSSPSRNPNPSRPAPKAKPRRRSRAAR